MLLTGCAFVRASHARRRATLVARLLRRKDISRLAVLDSSCLRAAARAPAVREIPITAISGTVEPARATLFDGRFRPTRAARARWQRVWLAEHRGLPLPPIDVVRACDAYAVRDGHHRVSVAVARGAGGWSWPMCAEVERTRSRNAQSEMALVMNAVHSR